MTKHGQTLADRIYIARALDGRRTLSQFAAELGAAAGRKPYSPNSLCAWEKGKSIPTIEAIVAIAKVARVRLEWLLEGKGEPRAHQHNTPAPA